MKNYMDVHFCDLDTGGKFVAFFPNSGRYFKTNENGKRLIEHVASGGEYCTLPDAIKMTKPKFEEYCETIKKYDQKRMTEGEKISCKILF